jgi:hypothetical protein
MSIQYRLIVAKKDERVEGPDDAAIVVTAPVDVVLAEGFDATVEFMRGKVKASGHTGEILAVLRTGAADEAFGRLAADI